MDAGLIADVLRDAVAIATKLGGPMLILSMAAGVIIAIFQAVTQIHEQTITFVPKLLVIGIILVFSGNRMLEMLQDFTMRVFRLIQG